MRVRLPFFGTSRWGAILVFLVLRSLHAFSATYQVLYSFTGGEDGGGLYASVILDKQGNLYSIAQGDGPNGFGTVFKLVRGPNQDWSLKTLHAFGNDQNGSIPMGNLLRDSNHNLYGTTWQGGAHNAGAIFELSPAPGSWVETVLYSPGDNPDDGGPPSTGVVMDRTGNLYGATAFGGPNGAGGTIYQLVPGPTGWTENVLYGFCGQPLCSDGNYPSSGLLLDAKGSLYGTTGRGGNDVGYGVVFKLRALPDGTWKFRVLHRFAAFNGDGKIPSGALARDSAGNLYGTTGQGGCYICYGTVGCGTIYRLTTQPNGHWKETILYDFRQNKKGNGPTGVVLDAAGNLYGTTSFGGAGSCDCGVVYKLAPNPDGTWTYSVLHSFTGDDGFFPAANLVFDDNGNLYGTTVLGGPGGAGVVFKLTP